MQSWGARLKAHIVAKEPWLEVEQCVWGTRNSQVPGGRVDGEVVGSL